MDVARTPDDRFADLDWPWAPRYLTQPGGLRQHYVDERPAGPERGTFLLLHGEPTWAYLYRDWIAPLVALGFRVVAPDHLGFGRSDKPTEDSWYTIAGHRGALRRLVEHLDLRRIHLVVQDWGGPIGLCAAVEQPERYARLFILNTWLHRDDFEYGDGIRWWRQAALDPGQLGGDMPTGGVVAGALQRPGHDVDAVRRAFDAPFVDAAAKAGARRFPFCLPFAQPELGDARAQAAARAALQRWTAVPIHVAFGDADQVFTWAWAEQWAAELPGATLDRIEGAGHFVQIDAPDDCLAVITRRLGG
ncbi:MAG: alpha/beta fold hydrolase [Acidimicrobiales bacterium]|nr:alpha/beta fold hydrolase [Acidimicrobiales bacterium]